MRFNKEFILRKLVWCIQVLVVMAGIHIVLAILFGTEAKAAGGSLDIRLTAGGYSKHLLSDDVVNESHDHFAIQIGKVELGRYNNSYGRESYYLAYEATWKNVLGPHIDAFLKSGVVYGYVDCLDRGSGIPKKRNPIEGPTRSIPGSSTDSSVAAIDDPDTSSAWCPMAAGGLRYTKWEIEPELTLISDALSLGASYKFNLMRLR